MGISQLITQLFMSFLLIHRSEEKKCSERAEGAVCVDTTPKDWKCPFTDARATPAGCPDDHICCIPNKKPKQRETVPGGCGTVRIKVSDLPHHVEAGEYPWHVVITTTESEKGASPTFLASGAIINKKWILTAAHVFRDDMKKFGYDDKKKKLKRRYEVVIGIAKRGDLQNKNAKTVQRIHVRKIVLDGKTHENDIALIMLDSPIQINDYAVPLCLPKENEKFNREMGVVTTWKSKGGLGYLSMDIKRCKKIKTGQSSEKKICSQNSCDLNIGSPLVVRCNSGQYFLAGVTSSRGCSSTESVYTEVSAYLDFIKSVTKEK